MPPPTADAPSADPPAAPDPAASQPAAAPAAGTDKPSEDKSGPPPSTPPAPAAPVKEPTTKAPRLHVTIAALPKTEVGEDAQIAILRELGDELRKNKRLEMKDLDVRLAEFAQEMPLDQVDLARAALQEGKQSIFKLDLDAALNQLADAVDQLIAVLPYIKKQELADAMSLLAVAQHQKSGPKVALSTLRRLFVWRPTYQPNPAEVPPAVMESVDLAKQQVSALGRGTVNVTSEPPGAQVFVDGEFAGVTPVSVPDLALGEHFVTYKKLGYKRGLRIAQVTSHGAQISAKLVRSEKYLLIEQAVEQVQPQMGQPTIDGVVDNLRETLFLDHTMFVAMKPTPSTPGSVTVQAFLYSLATKKLVSTKEVQVQIEHGTVSGANNPLGELCAGLYAGYDYEGSLQAPIDALPPAAVAEKPLVKRWWFWTAIGAAAAGTAVALGVGLGTRAATCPGGHSCVTQGFALGWTF